MTIETQRENTSTRRRWVAASVTGAVIVAGVSVAVLQPWRPDHPSSLSVTDALVSALQAKDLTALAELSATNNSASESAAQKVIAQLPDGQLTADKIVLSEGSGATSSDLELTMRSAQGSKTFHVTLVADVGPASLNAPEWKVAFNTVS